MQRISIISSINELHNSFIQTQTKQKHYIQHIATMGYNLMGNTNKQTLYNENASQNVSRKKKSTSADVELCVSRSVFFSPNRFDFIGEVDCTTKSHSSSFTHYRRSAASEWPSHDWHSAPMTPLLSLLSHNATATATNYGDSCNNSSLCTCTCSWH